MHPVKEQLIKIGLRTFSINAEQLPESVEQLLAVARKNIVPDTYDRLAGVYAEHMAEALDAVLVEPPVDGDEEEGEDDGDKS